MGVVFYHKYVPIWAFIVDCLMPFTSNCKLRYVISSHDYSLKIQEIKKLIGLALLELRKKYICF